MALRRPRKSALLKGLNATASRYGVRLEEADPEDLEADEIPEPTEAQLRIVKPIRRRARSRSDKARVYEDPLVEALECAGVPKPERNYLFARDIGRKWQLDLAWPRFMLAVEVEGGTYMAGGGRHNRGASFEKDALKYDTAALMGWTILRFGPKALKTNRPVEAVKLWMMRHRMKDGEFLEKVSQWGRLHPR